ncbi:MAG: type IV secretory system conjugative DNA transfer family protein [Clostridiales bacterium]|nr:type IV secretory system conjugative DNA transfer family protein [Clostridiales bacterium]
MQKNRDILYGYENMPLIRYDSAEANVLPNNIAYADLANNDVVGVLKGNRYVDGKLMQLYSTQENHVGVIAATRLGKTSSYVIPTVLSFAMQKTKRSMIISDCKGEIYRHTAATLRQAGYTVKLINFRDYQHSECWNPLIPIYRKYQKAMSIADTVKTIAIGNGRFGYEFQGVVYKSQPALDKVLKRVQKMMVDDVYNDIDQIGTTFITTQKTDDPYWEDSARELLKAYLIAMLEDSRKSSNPITEDTYSFSTIMELSSDLSAGEDKCFKDGGYFSKRPHSSKAYKIVNGLLFNNAGTTAGCIISIFYSKMAAFKDVAPRVITSANSFEVSELVEGPTAVFIDYRDEMNTHYQLISMFVQEAYRFLIGYANDKPTGKLDVPLYFILDEFGNFPKMGNFETVISASGGRNIFFIIVVQSYAQLDNVYGKAVAAIIRDNLNMHIFFGSNNTETLDSFSRECGKMTRVSPLSALNGEKESISSYQLETIPNVPVSMLSHFEPGECIITEANSGYVLFSRLERYFLCAEYKDLPQDDCKQYKCPINPFDEKYTYTPKSSGSSGRIGLFDDFNFDF